jgi:hypothetical protein
VFEGEEKVEEKKKKKQKEEKSEKAEATKSLKCMNVRAKSFPLKLMLEDTRQWTTSVPSGKSDKGNKGKGTKTKMKFFNEGYRIENAGNNAICSVGVAVNLGKNVEYELIGYSLVKEPSIELSTKDNFYLVGEIPPTYIGSIAPDSYAPFAFTLGTKDIENAPQDLPSLCVTSYKVCDKEDLKTLPSISLPIVDDDIDKEIEDIEDIEEGEKKEKEVTSTKVSKKTKVNEVSLANREKQSQPMELKPATDFIVKPFADYISEAEEEEYEESIEEHLEEDKKNATKSNVDDDEAAAQAEGDEKDDDDDTKSEDDSVPDSPDDDMADYKDDEYEYDRE